MYKFIRILPRVVPLSELDTTTYIEGVRKETTVASLAPVMVEALKLAQKALLFSRPIDDLTPDAGKRHLAAHQAACDILVALNELQPENFPQ